ncbi:class I SAM-dependent methyltransferase [Rubritepida flocculans]|uniref:class I SAM-dependent methyltransferase n=1 Tax=Rubritepida flocculans TaxID=182403 RepID=UPI00041AD61E|nr:class I SAM-dependent methyltransferase [Rubritepida flocculans]
MSWDTVGPYQRGFREFAEAYEAFGFEEIHADVLAFLPPRPGLVLDVGAGSGRDAAWFAARGWEVVAAEPAGRLRGEAARRHPETAIRWVDDRLPGLGAVHGLGLSFDLLWLSGVWQHVPPEERPRAMRKLATLLRPGGRMMVTLRHGPAPEGRPMWPVSEHEIERLGLDHGLALRVATPARPDRQGRREVTWQSVVLDLPDDGAGALPLLRGAILSQAKSATYKLALLRCVARVADAAPNIARLDGDEAELPLGLIALFWLRMFKPLVEAGLPQLPGEGMGFVKAPFRGLRPLAPFELRIGASFSGEIAQCLAAALRDAARSIAQMPATFLKGPAGQPLFPTSLGRAAPPRGALRLDQEQLWAFGATRAPLPVWRALQRYAAWIEPMLLAEWVRLTQRFGESQGRRIAADEVLSALRWLEPARDTAAVRRLAAERLARGEPVRCVWSGRALSERGMDIDHCLPWSAWPCGDLWNLLPAASRLNRHAKGERVATSRLLWEAKPRIQGWWREAYLDGPAPVRARFIEEARSSLPLRPGAGAPDLEELFAALDFRRLRLRQEALAPEWAGPA